MNKREETERQAFAPAGRLDRRRFLQSTALGMAAGLAAGLASVSREASAQPREPDGAAWRPAHTSFEAFHQLEPLPFDASKLDGLSARLIESHWSNNYGGSVRALNAAKKRLAQALADDNTPAFVYNGLKREHLMRTGSVVLHELYFENLGGNGRSDSDLRSAIGAAFGDFTTWEREFRRVAGGLGGGSGWVVFGYNTHFGTLENFWMADHMHFPASTVPLLVIDMYEHSYQMDYGASTAKYVDAFFRNIQWEVVAARVESCQASAVTQ